VSHINIDVSDKRLYTDVFKKIIKAKTRFVVNYGGAGSSKSVSQHQYELINIFDAQHNTLFIRKHASDLKDSCYALMQDIAKEWQVNDLFIWRFSNAVREMENKHTGAKVLFRGIDDPEKVKSIVGIKRIIVEEASELNFEDFLELNRRARGIEDIQIILILNPVSSNHWIKTKLIDNPAYNDRLTTIRSTYKDNPFLTESDIRELEALKTINENQYRIYVLGEWGIDDKNNKFAYAFERNKHVSEDINYNPNEYIYLSFDFNVDPITCVVVQYYEDVIDVVECIKLDNSDIYALCSRIKSSYPQGIFIVTGDATGQNRSAMVKDKLNYYLIIKQELGLLDSQFKVPKQNPRIEENRVLVNAVLSTMTVQVSEHKAEELIYDLTYVEVDENNKLVKDNRADKKQQADALDCFRYYCNTFHRNILVNKYLK